MKNLTDQNFKEEVLNFKGVVLVDFYADWCNPCKFLSPTLEALEGEMNDPEIKFSKINVDQNQQLAGQYGVMSIPTVILFKDGKMVEQKVGALPKDEYKKSLEAAKLYDSSNQANEVTVFTTPTCPYCRVAKEYLKGKNITFKEVDVSNDMIQAMKMVERSGQMGVPQIWVNNQVVVGFDKPRLDALFS